MSQESINYNLSMNTNYRFEIHDNDAGMFNYFIQDAVIPGLTMSGVEMSYQSDQVFMPSNRIDYDPFNGNFLVDEDFNNYLFLYKWMHKIKEADYPKQHFRDATLYIFSNNKSYNLSVKFYGIFPTSLGDISFMSNTLSTEPNLCSASFLYEWFEIKKDIA